MHIPARAWSCAGHVRRWRLSSLAALALLLGGCANLPIQWPGSALTFWAAAVEADEAARERMWRDAEYRQQDWQIALLQSLPDYHRYDPVAARRGLRTIVKASPHGDVGAIARLRLAELQNGRSCQAQVEVLQKRLAEIIAIERRLDNDGR